MDELIRRHVNLQPFNTMALAAEADYYVLAQDQQAICRALAFVREESIPLAVLGGGSNVIFAGNFPGLVLHVATRGISLLRDNGNDVLVRVAAGEIWDEFLQYCLQQHWYGLENLALIPGTVGAAPVQNIGAYGQEVATAIESVHIVYLEDSSEAVLANADCQFAYRESIFKHALQNKCVVTAVDFRLQKNFTPNLSYSALAESVGNNPHPAAGEIRAAVIATRQARLPLPQVIPNVGSFFKNPVVTQARYEELLQSYPQMPSFRQSPAELKLAAAWLIEQCGWRGKRAGRVGMHDRQALVMVNHGGATYADIKQLAALVQQDVARKFGVELEQEPVLVAA